MKHKTGGVFNVIQNWNGCIFLWVIYIKKTSEILFQDENFSVLHNGAVPVDGMSPWRALKLGKISFKP